MAAGDPFLRRVARAALLQPVGDPAVIAWRFDTYADCRAHASTLRRMYQIAVDGLTVMRGLHGLPIHNHPDAQRYHAVELLTELAGHLDRLRAVREPAGLRSAALRGFFGMLARELSDDYLRRFRGILRELTFRDGMLMSFGLGTGGEVVAQMLRRPKDTNRGLFNRTPLRRPMFSFELPDRDDSGARALSELRDRGENDVANAAEQSLDHVVAFFDSVRTELGFYLACLNLDQSLRSFGAPLCRPRLTVGSPMAASGLYDPNLALRTGTMPVGNDVSLQASGLLVITGANRGGKSTLLRALGTAQLMAQAGMGAPAASFTAAPVGGVFTHWAKQEDATFVHGKLDEELDRMERIVDVIAPGDLLLCNESFASTNEAEGSTIATEVVTALVRACVQVRCVTHLYDHARSLALDPSLEAVFVQAPRDADGRRSFRIEPGPTLSTSFGLDLYDRVFGTDYSALMSAERHGGDHD